MELGERGGASRFVMWTGRSVNPYGVVVYLVTMLFPALAVTYVTFHIADAFSTSSSAVPRILAISMGGAVVVLGAYVWLSLWWRGEVHFEAKNGRVAARRGTRRIRGRAVTFALAVPVTLYGEGALSQRQLSLRQDKRQIRLGLAEDVFPHEYVRWNAWLRAVGGSVDVQWELPPRVHLDAEPIAVDIETTSTVIPFPVSHRAALEIAMRPTSDAERPESSDGLARREGGDGTDSWLKLPPLSRRPQPIILVGNALGGPPVILFESPSDRFWLRSGPYVLELRFRFQVSEIGTSDYKGQSVLHFAPSSSKGDTAVPIGGADE